MEDIFTPGNWIVRTVKDELAHIVIVSKNLNLDEMFFQGFCIYAGKSYSIDTNYYSKNWIKEGFVQYVPEIHGQIELIIN
jgi:hypothetical protein